MRIAPIFSAAVFALLLFAGCHASHRYGPLSGYDDGSFWKTQPLNYQTLKVNLIDVKCLGCHNIASTPELCRANFETYENLIDDCRGVWDPPGISSIVHRALTRGGKNRMPPPRVGPALSDDEIDFIVRWIDAGRPEF